MKKIKYLLIILFLTITSSVYALSSGSVDYNIKSLYINVDLRNNGDAFVRELITLDGSFNGYERDLVIGSENKKEFDGTEESYKASTIYNASEIRNIKTGIINAGGTPTFSSLQTEVKYFTLGEGKNGDSGIYTESDIKNGKRIRTYQETIDGVTSFYYEYTLKDVIVKHEDIAEFYYTIVGKEFDDDIKDVRIEINLPAISSNLYSYASGPLYGEISQMNNSKVIITTKDLKNNVGISTRVLFDKDIVIVSPSKETGVTSLNKLIEIENNNLKEAEKKRHNIEILLKVVKVSSIVYIISALIAFLYVYLKYDKEYSSIFKQKYNREIIEDYPIPTVEYIMNKNITINSFNASILNLIYKKKMKVEKNPEKKDDYIFTLLDSKNLNESDEKIINMLFLKNGKNELTLNELKKYAKQTDKNGHNEFLNDYRLWEKEAIKSSEYYDFYENNNLPLKLLFIFTALMAILGFFQIMSIRYIYFFVIDFILCFIMIVYFVVLQKRSRKGIEEYAKWKAFKRFLKDFGKLDEKELPEIHLWDKFLIYATVLGVAKKVSKEMEIKFKEYGSAYTGSMGDVYTNYLLFNTLNREISNSFDIANAEVSKYSSSSSSFGSGGFGGGGGGGGRGF